MDIWSALIYHLKYEKEITVLQGPKKGISAWKFKNGPGGLER